jgi:hypothetical protein
MNGQITANPQAQITVTGGVTNLEGTTPGQGTYSRAPNQNQPPVADPLANLVLPSLAALTLSANQKLVHERARRLQGRDDELHDAARAHVITGDSTFNGNDYLNAPGVTLYFTWAVATGPNRGNPRACNPNEAGAGLKTVSNGTLSIQAPTTGPTAGLALISDRNNTSTLSYRGNGVTANTGTVYAKSGTLDYRGNGAGIA